jgi:hypothetical protein
LLANGRHTGTRQHLAAATGLADLNGDDAVAAPMLIDGRFRTTLPGQRMQVSSAMPTFEQRLATHSAHGTPSPTEGVLAMLAFFADVRADDCDPATGHDMLLFQWGTYDWGKGKHDEVDITRQFISPVAPEDEDDDTIWQLSLTYSAPAGLALADIPPGNKWCQSLADLPGFRSFLTENPAFLKLRTTEGWTRSVSFGQAG